MTSLESLIDHLKRRDVLSCPDLERAFSRVDRRDFVPPSQQIFAYDDRALPLGWGQTISQPYTVAFMLNLLNVKRGQSILDIGTGSGWTTALLAFLCGPEGAVTGLERVEELVNFGKNNLSVYSFPWAAVYKAGPDLGIPGQKFQRILVSASARIFPDSLVEQLDDQGILVIPVKNSLWKVRKSGSRLIEEEYSGFAFVPLVY